MPVPLNVKRPKAFSQGEQLVGGILLLGPLLGLWYLWRNKLDMHFSDPWLNFGAHAALVTIPLLWACMISLPRLQFEKTEEELLCTSNFFDKLPMGWWMMFMTWATPVFASLNLGYVLFTEYPSRLGNLSTTLSGALTILALTFVLGLFYATLLLERPQTFVSSAGLRSGLIRFFEWKNIHHFPFVKDLFPSIL